MSQMVSRLESKLSTVSSAVEKDELNARLAIALARTGRFSEAKSKIQRIRSSNSGGQATSGILWAMLAEGVTQLYESIGPSALDRISRAQILGAALQYRQVVALASAWKAHIEFEKSDFVAMASSIAIAVKNDADVDKDADTRIAVVLANAFAYAGDFIQSHAWFSRGHISAVENGDQVSIEALQYNRAALRIAWLRTERCQRELSTEEVRFARTELRSAQGLRLMMRVDAYVNHLRLCEARLRVLEGEFESAISEFDQVRSLSPFSDNNFSQELIDLEIGYCMAKMGDVDAARSRCTSPPRLDLLDVDDKVVAQWMIAQLSGIDAGFNVLRSDKTGLDRLLEELDALRSALRAVLDQFRICGNAQ